MLHNTCSVLPVAIVMAICVSVIICGDFIPYKLCATLHSKNLYDGEAFHIKDFDHIVDTKRDYRRSTNGWHQTQSFQVQEGCILTVYPNAYFQGISAEFRTSQNDLPANSSIQSAKCICKRRCSCQDIIIPQSKKRFGNNGRAYVSGSCNNCNSEYVPLRETVTENDYVGLGETENGILVVDIIISEGCQLIIILQDGTRRIVQEQITVALMKYVVKYSMICDTTSYNVYKDDTWLEIPENIDDLINHFSNNELFKKPGATAVIKTVERGKNHRNVYVFIFGEEVDVTTNFPLFRKCTKSAEDKLTECRIPVMLNDLKIESQLVIIKVPMTGNKPEHHAVLAANYQIYITSVNYFKEVYHPNVLILYENLNETPVSEYVESAVFLRKLYIMKINLAFILYGYFSSMLVYLDNHNEDFGSLEESINILENKITTYFKFPKPIHFVTTRYLFEEKNVLLNGYVFGAKFGSTNYLDFWPMQLEVALESICKMGEDWLGKAVFDSIFVNSRIPDYSIVPVEPVINVKKTLIQTYNRTFHARKHLLNNTYYSD